MGDQKKIATAMVSCIDADNYSDKLKYPTLKYCMTMLNVTMQCHAFDGAVGQKSIIKYRVIFGYT